MTLRAVLRARAAFRQSIQRTLAAIQCGGGDREAAAPELVEGRGEPNGDRTGGEYIGVGELGIRVHLKILIADIAAADQRRGIVDDQQLVVHPVVEPRGMKREFDRAPKSIVCAVDERVEYPNLDVRMSIQGDDLFIAGDGGAVVDQYPDTHAAISRPH